MTLNENWKIKYFEKNTKESHINIFRSLEIEKYLRQELKKEGFELHTYKLNFSNSTLNIFMSVHHQNKKNPLRNNLLKNITKSLNKFTDNKLNITLTIQIINVSNSNKVVKRMLMNFNKFKVPMLKRLYVPLMIQKNSAKLLGTFITKQLEKTKRHNLFFNSLTGSLALLINQQYSKIQGLKILIKGRLNNAPRSRNKLITLGKISKITKNVKLDYSESTAFTSNGTLGVKIWISEKP